MASFNEDCAVLLEMAQEVAMKYNHKVDISVFSDGRGWAILDGKKDIDIGFSEPFDKAIIPE